MRARTLQAELIDTLDRAVEGDPAHHLRKGKMPRLTATFPHAMIGPLPDRLQILQQLQGHLPGVGIALEPKAAAGVERIAQLAVNIELQLFMCRIADPHRAAVLVTGEPLDPEFGEPPLPGEP